MGSVADELRRERRERDLRMTPEERIRRALAMGRTAVELHRAAAGLELKEAQRRLERRKQRSRRPCRCIEALLA
ncbi:MAG: hypothetical protein ACE5GW_00620 [Planctomycetota bacterium]